MTPPDVSHHGRTLRIDDAEVELDHPVLETLVYDDLIVAVVEPPTDVDVRDNVFAFDSKGRKVWSIEPATRSDIEGSVVYVSVSESADGELLAHNWSEETYVVDPETGSVSVRDSRWSG